MDVFGNLKSGNILGAAVGAFQLREQIRANDTRDLLKNELGIPKNKIFVEPTLGSRSMLMQNINPHTFIQNLTKEAISKEDGSPNYVYYENKNGVFLIIYLDYQHLLTLF